MMADANAARKVFERMQKNNLVQDFTNIQWFPRPEDQQPSHNISTCGCEHTKYWCHACGYAYCLDCRSHGKACQHGPCHYSSGMSDAFLPDSIGSPDSPVDLVELIKDTLGQSAYFGSQPSEQSDNRREAFDDLMYRQGVESYPFADVVYLAGDGRRVPTLREHYVEMQETNAALPIWRPEIFDLSTACITTCLTKSAIELYRNASCLVNQERSEIRTTPRSDLQKDSYQLTLLNFNLGKVNRKPVIGGRVKFPSWIRNEDDCVVLPHLVFRNGAHMVSLLEAPADHCGIQKHEELARENSI